MIKVKAKFVLVLALLVPLPSHGAPSPFEIDPKELERASAATDAKPKGDRGRSEERSRKRSTRSNRQRAEYEKNREQRPALARKEDATHAAPQTASATKPTAPIAPAIATAVPPAASEGAAPPAATWICPVPERDPAALIDTLLTLLEASPSREKTVQAGQGGDDSVSVQVERYFEYQGGRYIVSIGESDPGRYTLLRLLENAGYRVLRLDAEDDFQSAGEKLLRLVGVAPQFGSHTLQQGKTLNGFLIRPEGTKGRRVVVSAEPLAPGEKWILAPECGAR